IDIIATDHAPHPVERKDCEWDAAAFGMVGLESALSIAQTALVDPGHASWADVQRLLSQAPARIGSLEGHPEEIRAGEAADLVLFDPSGSSVFDTERLYGKSENSPFLGLELSGRVHSTIRRGTLTFDHGQLVDAETVARAAHERAVTA
ncbi:amidohydrolase family protein, partial [Leucobacter sp. M11]|nr:amidohydrolase family protein [Leucobacter sp. M11]